MSVTASWPGSVLAIDAGTTSVRVRILDPRGGSDRWASRPVTQHYPHPGWVEHDADEIWAGIRACMDEVLTPAMTIAAIGITNQRETAVAWNRRTGRPYGPAIVWQDRRTASRCEHLRAEGVEELVRTRTGLLLDPYFSATKYAWMIAERDLPVDEDLALGTIDSWLIWNLTGARHHVTDTSNASRTSLMDLSTCAWDHELAALFGVPIRALPEIVASSGVLGHTVATGALPAGIPIAGIAGDQQAALFGQACFRPGQVKNTYGTGSFVLMNTGTTPVDAPPGLVTSVAWTLGDAPAIYALEGSVFVSGATIGWMRDGLGIIEDSAETEGLARSVESSDGLVIVPAFTGLGSPWWDPHARGTVLGITKGTTRAHLARAVVEAMALQTHDVLEAMATASGVPVSELRVDGGASAMELLLELQAALDGVVVRRPTDLESTSRGAAALAGLATGVWDSLEDLAEAWSCEVEHDPVAVRSRFGDLEGLLERWHRAVERSRGWSLEESSS